MNTKGLIFANERQLKISSLVASVLLHVGIVVLFSLNASRRIIEMDANESSVIQLVNIDMQDEVSEIPVAVTKAKRQSKDVSSQPTEDQKNGSDDEDAVASSSMSLAREYVKNNFSYISRRIQSKLVYPSQAKRTGIQGTVEIIFMIQKNGSASGITVSVSSGDSMLDDAAVAAIYAAAPFKPSAVPVRLAVPVVFSLR